MCINRTEDCPYCDLGIKKTEYEIHIANCAKLFTDKNKKVHKKKRKKKEVTKYKYKTKRLRKKYN